MKKLICLMTLMTSLVFASLAGANPTTGLDLNVLGTAYEQAMGINQPIMDRTSLLNKSKTDGFSIWSQASTKFLNRTDNSGYYGNITGLTVGGDYRFNEDFAVGLAAGYSKARSEGTGNYGDLVNNSGLGGFEAYGQWSPNEWNFVLDAGYYWGTSEVSNMRDSKNKKYRSGIFTTGFKMEYLFENEVVNLLPYAGFRYSRINSDVQHMNFMEIPVGIMFYREGTLVDDWKFKPYMDLGYTFYAGDLDVSDQKWINGKKEKYHDNFMDYGRMHGTLGCKFYKDDDLSFNVYAKHEHSNNFSNTSINASFSYLF